MVKNIQQDQFKSSDTCPHVDGNDARCGHRFSLGRIDQAFDVCFGSFHGCPMFHRLNGEASLRDGQEGSLNHVAPSAHQPTAIKAAITSAITSEGEAIELRPTGS